MVKKGKQKHNWNKGMTKMIKVMVADDNKSFAQTVTMYLQSKEDIEVTGVAYDGWECIEIIRETKPDVVLLDMLMPRLDGLAVLDRLHYMSHQPKVIMLTAYSQNSMIERAMLKGATDYLIKPFELEGIYDRVLDVCRNSYEYTQYPVQSYPEMMVYEPVRNYQSNVEAKKVERKRKPVEVEVTNLLHDMGVPAHVKGYQYLRDAILRVLADDTLMGNITKDLYPKIADRYDTTPNRVERAIRHAIELAWGRGNVDLMTEYFGYSINIEKGKPTNSEFIAIMSDRIRLNY